MSEESPEDRQLIREYLADFSARNERDVLQDARRWKARQQGGAPPQPTRRWWRRPLYQWGLLAGILLMLASLVVTWLESYPGHWSFCGSECRIEQRLERIEELLRQRVPP
jgi:hypothetical protein